MALPQAIKSKAHKYKCSTFKVRMICEYYKEMLVSAEDADEAIIIAEDRVRARQKNMRAGGYFIGDIEICGADHE